MKKSSLWITLIVVVILILAIVLFFYNRQSSQKNSEKVAQNTTVNGQLLEQTQNIPASNTTNEVTNQTQTNDNKTQIKSVFNETELSVFSTPLKSKASGRLNNIRLTCQKLDGYVIENGKTFSFNQVVGQPTSAGGYQEADVIINGQTQKAIGGGNCQVSTTIYNAVLLVNGIEVTERHEHGKDVSYVAEGKDAAVSYGSLDLKFINKTGKSLKLHVGSNDQYVTVQIMSIT